MGDSSQYSAGFAIDEFPPDGLLGMGFPEISVFGDNPFFQTLVAEGVVTAPEFGVKLAPTGSELFLGGVDTSAFTGDITNVPVNPVVWFCPYTHAPASLMICLNRGFGKSIWTLCQRTELLLSPT